MAKSGTMLTLHYDGYFEDTISDYRKRPYLFAPCSGSWNSVFAKCRQLTQLLKTRFGGKDSRQKFEMKQNQTSKCVHHDCHIERQPEIQHEVQRQQQRQRQEQMQKEQQIQMQHEHQMQYQMQQVVQKQHQRTARAQLLLDDTRMVLEMT
eukprot:278181_1